MTLCNVNGCTQVLRRVDEDEGFCFHHGTRSLTAPEPLSLPKETPSVENKGTCIDCGKSVKFAGTRCKSCNSRHRAAIGREVGQRRLGFASTPLGSLSQRPHDWVAPL